MVALIEMIKTCFRALGTFLCRVLREKYPLWLLLVVGLVAVLLLSVIGCSRVHNEDKFVVGEADYNGHDYLYFKSLDGSGQFYVIHDPDCICQLISE